jgi:putative flippase GtrA
LLINYYNYIFVNSAAYALGIITSFLFNRFFNFKIKNKIFIRLNRFLVVNITGLIISNFFLFIFNNVMTIFYLKIVTMPFIASFQFLLNYFWTFKKDD